MDKLALIMSVVSSIIWGCNDNDANGGASTSEPPPASLSYTVVNQYPHDTMSFTQGLTFYNGQLYESTGSGNPERVNNGSWVGAIDLETGRALKKIQLDTQYFGEGITILDDKLYFLTWTTNIGFVYDVKTFKKTGEFKFPGEGWGLTDDGKNLIMSNGTNNLVFYEPGTMKMISQLSVTDHNGPVGNLNELEYINGYIYANQWMTSYILKIDPVSGKVIGKMDCDSLYRDIRAEASGNYLNGIAYNDSTQKIYITGKLWPSLYEIRLQ
jgi:glutamine cyclotransferase